MIFELTHASNGINYLQKCLLPLSALLTLACNLAAVTPASERFPVQTGEQTVFLPYESNIDLNVGSATATRAVISIHSSGYDAVTYLANAQSAADMVPGASAETVIIAPHFLRNDVVTGTIDPGMVYWAVSPFWGSSQALVGPSAVSVRLSAYNVLDQLIDYLLNQSLFPKLQSIVFVGHSAGGQMVNRYAASSSQETIVRSNRDIHFRYVVLAPSTYIYMDNRRAVSGTTDQFAMPNNPGCTYNNYGYGLDALYSYHSSSGINASLINEQYSKRFVFYLVGMNDANPNDPSLDVSCQAMFQGSQRLERASIYFNHIQDFYGPEILNWQAFSVVPGVGHWGYGLMVSPQGLKFIFDYDTSDQDGDGHSDWSEWVWGSNHTQANSHPSILAEVHADNDMFRVKWQSRAHRLYRVMVSSDLVIWKPASDWLEGTANEMIYDIDASNYASLFVRIQVRLQ